MSFLPGDCIFTGLCGVQRYISPVPSGLLFVVVGLVLFGTHGLWRARSRKSR